VRLLSLAGDWVEGRVARRGPWLWVKPQDIVAKGMSGSPVISVLGAAIGIVSVVDTSPVIVDCLPGWLMRAIALAAGGRS